MERLKTWRGSFCRQLFSVGILAVIILPQRALAAGYFQHNLVSDVPLLADFTDPTLVNPWGIVAPAIWICNNRSGTFSVYGVAGNPTTTVTTVPVAPGSGGTGRCTGVVRNATNGVFQVSPGVNGTFIIATEDGLIAVRSGNTNVIKIDHSGTGAVYKGLALSNSPDFIYAANFNSGQIEVYDGSWNPATLAGNFSDPQVPAGFAPFNIQNIGGKLYVTYAKQDGAKHDDQGGPGNGYVAVFDLQGNLLQHLLSGGQLNSPWGIAIAPSTFGEFPGALLVANFRDGTINAFNATTGQYLGVLNDPSGRPITNIGIWALFFGIGGTSGDPTKLYFTAGISAGSGIQSHGLFAVISVAVTTTGPAVNTNGIVNNASYAVGTNAVAPGSIAAVFGTNLTDGSSCVQPTCNPTFDNGSPPRLRTSMSGAQVLVNGFPAPMFYASPSQVGFEVPTDLTGTSATVQIVVNGQASASRALPVDAFSPGIFTVNQSGTGGAAATHADFTPITTNSAAAQGEVIVLFATGLGQTSPTIATGAASTGTTSTLTKPTVTIDNIAADVQFWGMANCCVALNQVNVRVPPNVRIGNDITVVLSIGGKVSNTVTIATKAP